MKQRTIYITEYDKQRIEKLIAEAHPGRDASHLDDLAAELSRASVVAPQDVPADVVTMNSKVLLEDVDSSEQMTFTLVFPENADIDAGAISVIAPVGTAILGYSEGDIIEWEVPSGVRRLRIASILYQPEAAGDWEL